MQQQEQQRQQSQRQPARQQLSRQSATASAVPQRQTQQRSSIPAATQQQQAATSLKPTFKPAVSLNQVKQTAQPPKVTLERSRTLPPTSKPQAVRAVTAQRSSAPGRAMKQPPQQETTTAPPVAAAKVEQHESLVARVASVATPEVGATPATPVTPVAAAQRSVRQTRATTAASAASVSQVDAKVAALQQNPSSDSFWTSLKKMVWGEYGQEVAAAPVAAAKAEAPSPSVENSLPSAKPPPTPVEAPLAEAPPTLVEASFTEAPPTPVEAPSAEAPPPPVAAPLAEAPPTPLEVLAPSMEAPVEASTPPISQERVLERNEALFMQKLDAELKAASPFEAPTLNSTPLIHELNATPATPVTTAALRSIRSTRARRSAESGASQGNIHGPAAAYAATEASTFEDVKPVAEEVSEVHSEVKEGASDAVGSVNAAQVQEVDIAERIVEVPETFADASEKVETKAVDAIEAVETPTEEMSYDDLWIQMAMRGNALREAEANVVQESVQAEVAETKQVQSTVDISIAEQTEAIEESFVGLEETVSKNVAFDSVAAEEFIAPLEEVTAAGSSTEASTEVQEIVDVDADVRTAHQEEMVQTVQQNVVEEQAVIEETKQAMELNEGKQVGQQVMAEETLVAQDTEDVAATSIGSKVAESKTEPGDQNEAVETLASAGVDEPIQEGCIGGSKAGTESLTEEHQVESVVDHASAKTGVKGEIRGLEDDDDDSFVVPSHRLCLEEVEIAVEAGTVNIKADMNAVTNSVNEAGPIDTSGPEMETLEVSKNVAKDVEVSAVDLGIVSKPPVEASEMEEVPTVVVDASVTADADGGHGNEDGVYSHEALSEITVKADISEASAPVVVEANVSANASTEAADKAKEDESEKKVEEVEAAPSATEEASKIEGKSKETVWSKFTSLFSGKDQSR